MASATVSLRFSTPPAFVAAVEGNLVGFLQDHAANERKVSQSALSLAVQHPQRHALVSALIDVAREELEHFKRVFDLLRARGHGLGFDGGSSYMRAVHRAVKQSHVDDFLLDRLVMFSIVEARGHERFGLLASGLADPGLRRIYASFQAAEARHHEIYLDLARAEFGDERTDARLSALLEVEAEIARSQPVVAKLF